MVLYRHTPHESNLRKLLAHSSSCFSSLHLKYQCPCPHPLRPSVWHCGIASSALPHSQSPLNTVSSGAACKTAQCITIGTMTQWRSLTPSAQAHEHLLSTLGIQLSCRRRQCTQAMLALPGSTRASPGQAPAPFLLLLLELLLL